MEVMADFDKAWPIFATIASAIVAFAGVVQTALSIAKSRYELRKLRVEDEKFRAERARQKTRTEAVLLCIGALALLLLARFGAARAGTGGLGRIMPQLNG
jgi:hypothetical protein